VATSPEGLERLVLLHLGDEGAVPWGSAEAVTRTGDAHGIGALHELLAQTEAAARAIFAEGSLAEACVRFETAIRLGRPELTERTVARLVQAYAFWYR
jgi:hypothetical protein